MKKEKNIGDVIQAMYEKYRMTQKISEVRIVEAWEKITGPMISKHTVEIKLVNKTLYLKFDNPPLKDEMMYRRQSLIDAINLELGSGTVLKLFIK